ncbi:Uma2 family endonuclease [soil metagenome]
MAVAVSRMSAAEYLATPEDRPRHTELINATVVVNQPKLPHARAQANLLYELRRWLEGAEAHGYISLPTDVVIDDENVFAPDLWWVGAERIPTDDELYLDGIPDLVVEVRSPSTWARDVGIKLPAYEAAGVAEAWYLDTEARTVLVFRRSAPDAATFDVTTEVGTDEELTSAQLPGFALRVGAIFER